MSRESTRDASHFSTYLLCMVTVKIMEYIFESRFIIRLLEIGAQSFHTVIQMYGHA